MADEFTAPVTRRLKLEQVFGHLADLGATVDVSGITDPDHRRLMMLRTRVAGYGAVGPEIDLAGVTFTPVSANGVPAEWVTADGADPARRVVYLHGGSWAAGSPLSHRPIAATLARRSRASVLMVDYRLAPEHRYPAGLDDCVAAYQWALANGPAGETPINRICLAGDSAGGNLSAAVCVRLATTGGRMPDQLVLIAGMLDNVSMSERINPDDRICTPDALRFAVKTYLTSADSAADPEISPAFASTEVLAKFPPTLIQVSTSEALAYDSKRFADCLEKARVRVNLSLWPDMPHVWHVFLNVFPEAAQAIEEIAAFIGR